MQAVYPAEAPEAVRIARILGLARPDTYNDLGMAKALEKGVPARSVEHVVKRLDPSGVHMKVYDFIPKSTYHRCQQQRKPLSKDLSEQLWQVARVFVEAQRHYGDDREALDFLLRPHPLLDGATPLALAKETSAGADLVLRLLAEAEAGVAV